MITRLDSGHHVAEDHANIIVKASSKVSFEGKVRNLVLHEAANVRIVGSLSPDFVINRGAICLVLGTVNFGKTSVIEGELQVQGMLRGKLPNTLHLYVKPGTLVQENPEDEVLEVGMAGNLVPRGSLMVAPIAAGNRPWLQWLPPKREFLPLF